MGLQHISDEGDLHWNCHNDCPPLKEHISHDQVEWIPSPTAKDPPLVALPPCPGCGSRTFLSVIFSEKDLTPPLIVRNADGTITEVQVLGAPNFTQIEYDVRRYLVPHPEKPGEAIAAFEVTIKDVRPHPMVARHQKLHQLLHQHGKPAPQKAS
jgi:hypothetical protein